MAKKIKINGTIIPDGYKWIYDLFGVPSTCPKDVADILDSIDEKDPDKCLDVYINSGGGSVSAGSEIYTMLMEHARRAEVRGYITGMAASAASVIAMACSHLEISPTGEMMIHNASTYATGDKNAMTNAAELLSSTDEGICNAYILKTGMKREELLDLMNKTTWMNAHQALKMGFVDKIMFDEGAQLVASADAPGEVIPEKVIDYMRRLLAKTGSIPEMGSYTEIINQKGDGPMKLQDILASLPEDQRQVVMDAIAQAKEEGKNEGKAEAEQSFEGERTKLQNTIDELKQKAATNTEPQEDILANVDPKVKEIIDAAIAREAAARSELEAIREANELKKYTDLAASFQYLPIDANVFGPIFKNFAAHNSEDFEKLQALLQTADNCISEGKLFNTVGSSNAGDTAGASAWDIVQNKVRDLMAQDGKLSRVDAMTQVFKNDPDLYNRYVAEMRGGEVPSTDDAE